MRLSERIKQACLNEGFSAVATVDFGGKAREIYDQHFDRYENWIKNSAQAEMAYLARGLERRKDPNLVFEGLKSVVCVALNYPAATASTQPEHDGARYARYLETRDYHLEIAERFERALKSVGLSDGKVAEAPLQYKICVDTSAVLERTWGAISGLGWIGKNTLLMNRNLGSFFLIGVAFLGVELGAVAEEVINLCGHCTRCIDACPTEALSLDLGLDSNRCIGYWTIEKRGSLDALSLGDRKAVGSWVAGCDICQEVCPFNQKRMKREPIAESRALTNKTDLEELLSETEAEYRERVANSAMTRIRYENFKRNTQIVYENRKPKI